MPSKSQQLYASNVSVNFAEALQARVKDPLWFLARQWQTGEFEAENGGSLASAHLTWREHPLTKLTFGAASIPVALDAPLDALVEGETSAGDSPAWSSEALDYSFGAATAVHSLVACEYHGKGLDWFHFDLAAVSAPPAAPPENSRRVVPTALQFRGMPHPRWWRFEEGDADFERPADPEPNILSALLPEFTLIDSNNWYVLSLRQQAGTIRELTSLEVVEGFGVVTALGQSDRGSGQWRMFSLSPAGTAPVPATGAILFVPNIATEVLDNGEVEEIVFMRDEDANIVWAVERLYRSANGEDVRNGDRPGADPAARPATPTDDRPAFRFRSDIPPHWIPYVPRFTQASGGSSETYLRRGRTDESASIAAPQHSTRIIAESWRLREEEIPRSGLRVRRTKRFARGSDGTGFTWQGPARRRRRVSHRRDCGLICSKIEHARIDAYPSECTRS